jgi:glycosyltransferase involved in cell wall biosynthesis
MSNPILALCIPAYNASAYLPRLLASAHRQKIPFDEILVYNDCSTDNTAQVAAEYGARVIEGDVNRGCSYGKNKLAEVTACEWIHFHDADDDLLPNFTALAHKWISKNVKPDIIVFNYSYVDYNDNRLLATGKQDRGALVKDAVKYTILNKIVNFGLYNRKSFINAGGFDTDPLVLYNEDVAFHCRMAIAGLSFDFENEISIINYKIGRSMSGVNQLKCAQAHFHVMRKNAEKVGEQYGYEIAQKLWANAGILMSLSDWETAKQAIELAVRLNGKRTLEDNCVLQWFSSVNPYWGYRFREYYIRAFKPALRR